MFFLLLSCPLLHLPLLLLLLVFCRCLCLLLCLLFVSLSFPLSFPLPLSLSLLNVLLSLLHWPSLPVCILCSSIVLCSFSCLRFGGSLGRLQSPLTPRRSDDTVSPAEPQPVLELDIIDQYMALRLGSCFGSGWYRFVVSLDDVLTFTRYVIRSWHLNVLHIRAQQHDHEPFVVSPHVSAATSCFMPFILDHAHSAEDSAERTDNAHTCS